ncbi:MAG: dihydroorotase, partial [Chitinophagaceae bacterium]
LRKGVEDGTVDCIATHHQPHEWDSKTCEFEYAKPGMIGLETCYSVLVTLGLSTDTIVRVLSSGPRDIIGLYNQGIREKSNADLTLFVTNQAFTVTNENIRSKSRNTPFMDKTLKGKVVGIVNKDGLYLNN